MPIEFHCSSCNKILSVPETASGKQARCPDCEQIVTVPTASATKLPPKPAETPSSIFGEFGENPYAKAPEASSNPYASPAVDPTPQVTESKSIGNGKLEATRAVSIAWTLFKEHAGVLIGSLILIGVAGEVVRYLQEISQTVALHGGAGMPQGVRTAFVIFIVVVFYLIGQAVQTFLTTGLTNIQLHIARGQRVDFGMLFSGSRWFLKAFLASLLFGIMVLVGTIALVVPGVYLALKYWSYLHFIVDRDCEVMESFKLAGEASNGNMGETLLLVLIGIGLIILGLLMCLVGILVTTPVLTLSYTIAYLMMTGQPIGRGIRGAVRS